MPNGEELVVPTVPPPPEQPEFFPGFGQELQQLGVEQYKAQKRLIEAEREMAQMRRMGIQHPLTGGLLSWLFGPPEGFMAPITGGLIRPEDYERGLQLVQQEYDIALQGLKSIRWRQEIMVTLPNYLSLPDYKIQSSDDILNYIPLDSMTETDIAWLSQTYERMKHLSNVIPEGFTGDAIEAQTKILNEILTAPKLELKGVHNLTVDEIAKSFAFGVAEMPQGMTDEDVRSILSQMDLQEEEMKEAKEWLALRAKDWAIESDRLNLIRAGLVLAEEPELTPGEFAKLLVTQPMMATVELLDKYFSILARPAAAAAIIGVHRLFKTPDDVAAARLDDLYNYYRSMGESSWRAYAMAFNEWDAPWWLKLGTEVVFDPISYIGFGFIMGVGSKLGGVAKASRYAMNRGTRIGNMLIDFEAGFISGADAVFKAGVRTVLFPIRGAFWLTGAGYGIPRTATQLARNFARKSMMDYKAVLERTFPEVRNLKGLTVKDITDTADNCIRQALERPTEGHDLAVRAGANMLEFNYIDDIAARRLVRDVAEEVVFDTPRLARVNTEILNMFSGQGERVTAGKIIGNLGMEATEDMVVKLSAKLVAFREKIAKSALAAVKGDAPQDVLMNIFNHLEGVRYSNIHSPLTSHMVQAGRTVSWVTRVSDRILYSTQLVALERRLVMPVARWNLLFTNFGPYNFLENMQRSFLGGGEILHPKSYSGVAETNRLFKGLTNAPYELQMFERGEERLAQAMIDPRTGRTAVFQRGNVPFVTKEVTIPEKIPFLGGKTIGAKINIAGRDHYLASFQDAYDMWAHLNSKQVAYDYQVHYMKALADVAPDDMRGLVEAIANRRAELDNIAAISKSDARDIERVLMQDATVGPADVRAHAKLDVLEFERRQISKELGKLFDRMTDVRATTKKGIQDEVLDGSIFKDIDNRMAAFVESERELSLVSLRNQMDVLTNEADAFLANPPRNLDEFLGDMQNISAMVEGTGERIHDYRRLTELRKAKLSPADFDDFEVGSAELLSEFMETSEEQLVKMMNQLVDNARGLHAGGTIDWTTVNTKGLGQYEAQIKKLVDDLPLDIRFGIKAIRFDARLKTRYAHWNAKTKTIVLRSPEHISSLPHELGHSIAFNWFETRNFRVLDDFVRAVGEPPIDWTRIIAKGRTPLGEYDEFYKLYKGIEEGFADNFRRWTAGELLARRGMKAGVLDEFFRTNFPKQVTSRLNETQLARLTDLDSVSRLELENILATRNKVASIEAIIPTTPKRARTARFWSQQRSQKATIWDEYDSNARKFKSLRLRASRNFLQSVDKQVYIPDYVPEVVAELTPNHLAYLYGATGDDLYRGLTRVQHHITIRPREDFILHTVEQADAYAAKFGKTASEIGFTDNAVGEVYDQLWRNLGVEPTILTPDSPTVMQLEEIRQELTRLYGSMKIPESDVIKWRQYINSVADDVEKLSMYKAPVGVPEWWASKESAMTKAREMHALAYPTYDDANVIDEAMRAIFPFWNYEMFRWRWIPRTWMRTPGTMTGLARYMSYTDQGYLPVPGTDLQMNILRGSVWMGGLRSFYLRDFPEYYDSMPGMEFIDYIGRMGFFPGIHVMAPIVLWGATVGEKPELAQLSPAWVRTSLSGLRALSPQHIGKVLDIIYPDRFRDYMTMLTLGGMGYDADLIWRKKKLNEKLTEEEERLWLQAVNKVDGIKGILMQQTGLFRIRPDEFTQIRSSMRKAIEGATGVPVSTQEHIDRLYPVTGKRFSDYYHLDILQTNLLYQWETYRRWRGVTTPLYPSSWQMLDVKRADYYEEVEKVYDEARRIGTYEEGELVRPSIVEINRQWIEGEIGPDQWRALRSDIQGSLAEAVRVLGESPAYKDVPKTLEEMAALLEERGIPVPTQTPDQELLYYYYELRPEYKWNWEAQRMERDFDTYYAYIDILLESLDATHRERLLQRIQVNWTPLERLYWQISREHVRPYRNLRNIVLAEYDDEQRQLIRRYEVARGAERDELREIMGPEGDKLISGFARRLREARLRFRVLDPTTDAWLNFFGTTDKLMTTQAQEIYDGLREQFLTAEMIG